MALTVEQIAQEASALPQEERAKLVERLATIFDPTDNALLHDAWASEALRRRDEVRSGAVATIEGEAAFAQVRAAVGR